MFMFIMSLFLLFFGCIGPKNICYAQTPPSVSQIQRQEEMLEKERGLRSALEEEEKLYVKYIKVRGADQLTPERIKEIISPFQEKRWLTKSDIGELVELIRKAYAQEGYKGKPDKISYSYEFKKRRLIIEVEELKLLDKH